MFEDIAPVAVILTAVVAVSGFIINWYRNQYRVKVVFSTLIPGYPIPGEEGLKAGSPLLGLEAKNVGERTVTLSSWGFQLPDKTYITQGPQINLVRFPYELAPGKSVQVGMDYTDLARTLKTKGYSGKIIFSGFFKDQLDHRYSKRSDPFEVEEFLQRIT